MGEILTVTEKKVLQVLADAWPDSCLYTRGIMCRASLERLQTRRAVKALVRKGLAELVRGLFDDDGKVAGSGYASTPAGRALISKDGGSAQK